MPALPEKPLLRRSRLYPALALVILTALLLAQYRSHHIPLPAPILAIAPPPYAATRIHLSAATLSFPDFLQQLTTQSPVPIKTLWSPSAQATQPTMLTFPTTDFPLADLPLLLLQNPAFACTAVFDPNTLLLGNDSAIHSISRATLVLYPLADLITPSVFDETSASSRQSELADLITNLVAPATWREQGGTLGSIGWHDTTLVITTTPDIHYQVQSLLTALRRL